MPCVDETFHISGPFHLASIDWKEADHRRWVAASLVKGVYIYEKDRQQKRTGIKALAPIWWESFEFKLINILIDQVDSSAFGAIFEYKPHSNNYQNHVSPRYVVAFRGTITKAATRKRDICLDIQIPLNGLVKDTRLKSGFEVVQDLVTKVGSENVWLTGHSLGAAIALRVGKDMAKTGYPIETYLFNPPYGSIPIDKLASGHLNSGIRIAKSVATAGISRVLNGRRNAKHTSSSQDDPFIRLCSWVPYIFVNPNDLICSEFIGHFEHRGRMEAIGAGRIERIATQTSILCLVSGALLGRDGEASFLVPSAFVTKNMVVMDQDLNLAHGLEQWWKPHSCWESKLYQLW